MFATSATAATTFVTKRDQWQVSTTVPPRLEEDGGNLFRIAPSVDRFTQGRIKWIVTWSNFSGNAVNERAVLQSAAEPGTGALIDRALKAAELLRFQQRVLWYEAEVLVVHPSNPVCASGLTKAQAVSLLDGTTTEWTPLITPGSWPTPFVPLVHGYKPVKTPSGYLEPYFGVTAYGAELRASSEQSARTYIAGDEHAFAPMRYSDVRGHAEVCAVAIDGVKPDDTTVRAGTYAPSFAVRWITAKVQTAIDRRALKRYEFHLFGARGAAYLAKEAGRNRLR
ncbi:MAG: hypothetical protein JWL76_1087 [Thermoleophilia bacterium]|nr:hypothetical protein [Thermoleophilia bacterium]